jgi:hypothetical protein
MGAYGSGNHGGRPALEAGRALDLYWLLRQGLARPGRSAGSVSWTNSRTGRETASLGYEAQIGKIGGSVRLRYTITSPWTGKRTAYDQRIGLVTTPQPFGGRRWWWLCPLSGDLVARLHMPAGGGPFASRRAHRLAYRSQREGPWDRALRRAYKLRRRLGSTGIIGDGIVKPKGMRWATFARKRNQLEATEAVCAAHLLRFAWPFERRLKR